MRDHKPNRTRKRRLEIPVTEEERDKIVENMKRAGMTSISDYGRTMLIYGQVERYDYSDLKTLIREIAAIGTNVNQVAKRANETRNIFLDEVRELQKQLQELQKKVNAEVLKEIRRK